MKSGDSLRGFEITATGGSSILNVQILRRTSSYSKIKYPPNTATDP
jgi:hypothetical protein